MRRFPFFRAPSVSLTRRGWGVLVVAIAGLSIGIAANLGALLTVMSFLVGLLFATAAFVLLDRTSLHVERSVRPELIFPNQPINVTVVVRNLSRFIRFEATWQEELSSGLTGVAQGILPPLGTNTWGKPQASVRYAIQGVRRGRHRLGPIGLRISDPFGIWNRACIIGEPIDLDVMPVCLELAGGLHDVDEPVRTRNTVAHLTGSGEDDVIARPYVAGDALKRMHWKSTARQGQLMVRQSEHHHGLETTIILDNDAAGFGVAYQARDRWAYSPMFEWAVAAVASIAAHLVAAGQTVTLRNSDRQLSRTVGTGRYRFSDALADLALIAPADDLEIAPSRERRVLVVTSKLSVERARAWTRALNGVANVSAFVAAGTAANALEILTAHHWRIVEYGPRDRLKDRWAAMGEDPHAMG